MLLPLSTFNDFLSFLLFKRLRLNNLTIYIIHTNKVIDIKLLEFYCRFYVTLPDISFTRLSPREKTKEVVSSEGGKSRSEEKLVNEKDGGINRSWLRETRGCTRWQGSRVSTRRFLHFTGFAPTINQLPPTIKPWYSRRRYTEVSTARLVPLQLSCSRPEEREEEAERRQGARHKDNGPWARKTLRHFGATRSDDVQIPRTCELSWLRLSSIDWSAISVARNQRKENLKVAAWEADSNFLWFSFNEVSDRHMFDSTVWLGCKYRHRPVSSRVYEAQVSQVNVSAGCDRCILP